MCINGNARTYVSFINKDAAALADAMLKEANKKQSLTRIRLETRRPSLMKLDLGNQ